MWYDWYCSQQLNSFYTTSVFGKNKWLTGFLFYMWIWKIYNVYISCKLNLILGLCDHKHFCSKQRAWFWKHLHQMQFTLFEQGMLRLRIESMTNRHVCVFNNDATFFLWTFIPANTSPFWTTAVTYAPGAGVNKTGPVSALCGSTQIREELFIRDCGVLSFTTTYFLSFHHAAIKPTLPRIFTLRPGQKHGFG